MTSSFYIFSLELKAYIFKHNRIVSRHKAFVSSTNVNCLISEEVQHRGLTCKSSYWKWALLKGALICGFPCIYCVIEHLKKASSIENSGPSPWPEKVPTIVQFSIFNFCCWKEGLFTKPRIFRFSIPFLSWSRVQIHKQTALQYRKLGSSLHNKVCFFSTLRYSHLCNLQAPKIYHREHWLNRIPTCLPSSFFSPTITSLSLQLFLVVLHVFCCWKSSTIISIHILRKPTNSPA